MHLLFISSGGRGGRSARLGASSCSKAPCLIGLAEAEIALGIGLAEAEVLGIGLAEAEVLGIGSSCSNAPCLIIIHIKQK
jgi:hypothetical protein